MVDASAEVICHICDICPAFEVAEISEETEFLDIHQDCTVGGGT